MQYLQEIISQRYKAEEAHEKEFEWARTGAFLLVFSFNFMFSLSFVSPGPLFLSVYLIVLSKLSPLLPLSLSPSYLSIHSAPVHLYVLRGVV